MIIAPLSYKNGGVLGTNHSLPLRSTIPYINCLIKFAELAEPRSKRDLRFLFRTAILSVRFMCRMKNFKRLKLNIDRAELRRRPFRNRDVGFDPIFLSSFLPFRFVMKLKQHHSQFLDTGSTVAFTIRETYCLLTRLALSVTDLNSANSIHTHFVILFRVPYCNYLNTFRQITGWG